MKLTPKSYEDNPPGFILTKITIDVMLEHERYKELIALYIFYSYTSCWQKEKGTIVGRNVAWSTTNYTAKQLGWSEDSVRKYKKELMKLGLIENIVTRGQNNKITGHYIRIKYMSNEPPSPQTQRVAFQGGILNNIINKENRQKAGDSKRAFVSSSLPINELAKKLKRIIERKGNLRQKHQVASYAKQIRQIHTKQGSDLETIEQVIDWLAKHIKDTYTPKLFQLSDFSRRFNKLEAAMIRYLKETGQYEENRSRVKEWTDKNGDIIQEFYYDED